MATFKVVCDMCDTQFLAKSATAKYCSNACREIMYPNFKKKEAIQRVCLYCNTTFYTAMPNKKTCSESCAEGNRQDKLRQARIESFRRSVDRMREKTENREWYVFCNEADFAQWFSKSYWFYGLKRILSQGARFPDVTALDRNDRVLRIELEYNASNFKTHNHPSTCDVIMSMVSSSDRVAGIPVIALFQKENGIVKPSDYLASVMDVGIKKMVSLIGQPYYEQINCTYPVDAVIQQKS